MSGRADEWMPLWIGDYLADTMHLTTEQHGAYLLLIMDYWRRGSSPDDDKLLAAIAKISLAKWKILRSILSPFFAVENGRWTHKRIETERAKALANKEKNAERASKAANARWNAPSNAPSIPQAVLNGCPSPSTPPSANASIETSNDVSGKAKLLPEHVIEIWNKRAEAWGLPLVKTLSRERKQRLVARIREHPLEDFLAAFDAIERSAFLRGENKNGWRADIDFFCQKSSFIKLVEGSYDH